MNLLLLVIGLSVAFLGSSGAAALVATARATLAATISRRLRGGDDSLYWVSTTQRQVAASAAATSLGVALVGAVIPGLLGVVLLPQLALLVAFLVVPVTLLGGYLLPRWFTVPRAERTLEWLGPIVRGWSALLAMVLPARSPDPSEDVRALAREGSANGLGRFQRAVRAGRPQRSLPLRQWKEVQAMPRQAGLSVGLHPVAKDPAGNTHPPCQS